MTRFGKVPVVVLGALCLSIGAALGFIGGWLGVDKLIEATWIGKTFGVQPSYGNVQIPLDATHRVSALIQSEPLVMLISLCHPKWQEWIYESDLSSFHQHAGSIERALLELRSALIAVAVRRKTDIGDVRNNQTVTDSVSKIAAIHNEVLNYARERKRGEFTLREVDRTLHYLPTAWDWRFSRKKGPMLVTLNDGMAIRGYFGPNSCVSTDPNERDIYLDPMGDVIDGALRVSPHRRGILIKGNAIRHIQFYADPEQQPDQSHEPEHISAAETKPVKEIEKRHARRQNQHRPTA